MKYASTTWGTAAKTNKNRLDKVQNIALWVILGAMKTTPVHDMENTANVEPLERRRSLKVLIQGEKLEGCLPSLYTQTWHSPPKSTQAPKPEPPVQRTIQDTPRHCGCASRAADRSCLEAWQRYRHTNVSERPRHHLKGTAPWRVQKPHPCPDCRQIPHNVWTHVYTGGSAEERMKNGGSGVYIKYPDGDTTPLSVPGDLQCSNYRAEIMATCTAAEHMLESGKNMGNIAIFADSLSTLQALNSADPDQMI